MDLTADLAYGLSNVGAHYLHADGFEGADDGDCLWFASDIPFSVYNGVLRFNADAEAADRKIADLVEQFTARQRPWLWFVPPSCSPNDLGKRLEARGMESDFHLTALAATLDSVPPPPSLSPDVEIREATNESDVRAYAALYPKLFGAQDETFIDDVVKAEISIFRRGPTATTRYVGLKSGEVVAAGSASSRNGLATLDTLCTLPEHRNFGIGGALALHALEKERAKGANRAVIWAGPGAEKLYARLGFREYGPVAVYSPTAG